MHITEGSTTVKITYFDQRLRSLYCAYLVEGLSIFFFFNCPWDNLVLQYAEDTSVKYRKSYGCYLCLPFACLHQHSQDVLAIAFFFPFVTNISYKNGLSTIGSVVTNLKLYSVTCSFPGNLDKRSDSHRRIISP